MSANFLIDFYFTIPEFQQSLTFDDKYKQVPLGAVVNGVYNMDSNLQKADSIKNEYSFFEFRSRVEIRDDLYKVIHFIIYLKIYFLRNLNNSLLFVAARRFVLQGANEQTQLARHS
jgi:hypothetical protein